MGGGEGLGPGAEQVVAEGLLAGVGVDPEGCARVGGFSIMGISWGGTGRSVVSGAAVVGPWAELLGTAELSGPRYCRAVALFGDAFDGSQAVGMAPVEVSPAATEPSPAASAVTTWSERRGLGRH